MAVITKEVKQKPAHPDLDAGELAGQSANAENEFDILFRSHWNRVCELLYRMVGDQSEAEDLALETFWRLYTRSPSGGEQLKTGWLYRVATNLGYNALRSRKRRQRYEEQAGKLALESNAPPNPAQEAERSEQQELVRQTLAAIKPRSAQLLFLRHTGLSYAAIAQALAIPPGSVGTLLARAEKEFRVRYRALERLERFERRSG